MKKVEMYICDICQDTHENEKTMLIHEEYCIKKKIREDAEKVRRVSTGQLTIQQIIDKCHILSEHKHLHVFIRDETCAKYHNWSVLYLDSYRGYYDELAIDPCQDSNNGINLGKFTQEMEESIGAIYGGWKCGEYTMYQDTFVWISEVGHSSGLIVKDLKLSDDSSQIWLIGCQEKSS